MGDTATALDFLERGYQDHAFFFVFLNVDPLFDPIRHQPRFKEIIRRMRF